MLGLKMGVENDIFWSEVGSGFGEPGSTPPPRIPRSTPLLVSIDLVSWWPKLKPQAQYFSFYTYRSSLENNVHIPK